MWQKISDRPEVRYNSRTDKNPPLLYQQVAETVGVPMTVKLLGAIVYGREWCGYWSLKQWSKTSNLTLTALCKILRSVQTSEGRLPRKLMLQMDNAGRDNKNHFLVGFCGLLLFDQSGNQQLPTGSLRRWLVEGQRFLILPRQRAAISPLLHRLSSSLLLRVFGWEWFL